MLGISIYPDKQDLQELKRYIDVAHSLGYKRIFTCLLSVDGDKQTIINKYAQILKHADQLNMDVTLDIAPRIFAELNISYDDLTFFKEMGASTIRLDQGFDGLKEAQMTFNPQGLNIEINMSNGTKYLDNILSYQPNHLKLRGCHNFYPQEYTGLRLDHFMRCSFDFKKQGIRTAAFINSPTATTGPWPIMDGLCTVEMHRNLPLVTQLKHLMTLDLIDDIFIANAFASTRELEDIASTYFSNLLTLNVTFSPKATKLEKDIVLHEKHFNRGDISNYMIRSTQSRVKYKTFDFPIGETPEILKKGDIIIGNNNFGQYKGELQLILADQKNTDQRRNVVAKVDESEIFLIDYIKPWSSFAFIEKHK